MSAWHSGSERNSTVYMHKWADKVKRVKVIYTATLFRCPHLSCCGIQNLQCACTLINQLKLQIVAILDLIHKAFAWRTRESFFLRPCWADRICPQAWYLEFLEFTLQRVWRTAICGMMRILQVYMRCLKVKACEFVFIFLEYCQTSFYLWFISIPQITLRHERLLSMTICLS